MAAAGSLQGDERRGGDKERGAAGVPELTHPSTAHFIRFFQPPNSTTGLVTLEHPPE
jgi:hypothetical protein